MAVARFLFLFGLIALSLKSTGQIQSKVDSLQILLRQSSRPVDQINLYNDLVEQYAEANLDSALKYARLMHRVAKETKDQKLIARALRINGLAYDFHYKFDSAHYFYNQSLALSAALGDSTEIAGTTFNIGVLYYFENNFAQALEKFKQAEILFRQLKLDSKLAKLYNNMGVIYRKNKQYESAIDSYMQSLAIKEKANDTKGILNTLTNLSALHVYAEQYEKGKVFSKRAVELALQVGDSLAYESELINLGVNTFHTGKPQQAIAILTEAEQKLQKRNLPILLAECRINLADINISLKQFKLAEVYLNKLKLMLAESTAEVVSTYYKLEARYYQEVGNFKAAFASQANYIEAREVHLNEQIQERTKEFEVRFQSEQKERQIASLEVQKQADALQLSQQANQRNLFIASTLGLVIISGLIFFQFRQKNKSNKLLTEKNEVIGKALEDRETLLREIHHRVKNNLQIISSLLNLQSRALEDKVAQGAVVESKNRVKSMALIHEQLYQQELLTGVTMATYIQQLANSLAQSYGVDDEKVEIKINADEISLDVDTAIPIGLILNELISNAIKYAFEDKGGKLEISFKQINSKLELIVADNGKGFRPETENTGSFGLKLVHSLARKLRAEVNINAQAGTRVELLITDFQLAR